MKPSPIATNRFGAVFGRARKSATYRRSGRLMASYYTHVCLRCGWAFKPPRHKGHRLEDCNSVRREARRDPLLRKFLHRNLHEGQR